VLATQHGLDSLEDDVATVKRARGRVSSPIVLVGHSYGGTRITAAGTDDRPPRAATLRSETHGSHRVVYEVNSSHVPMLSQPSLVIDVIRTTTKAVQARVTVA